MKEWCAMNYKDFTVLLMSAQAGDYLRSHPAEIARFVPEMAVCIGFEQNNPYHIFDVYEHTAQTLRYAPMDFTVRMALFFHDIGKPECYSENEQGGHFIGHGRASADIASQVLARWDIDEPSRHDIVQLIFYHDASFSTARKYVKKWVDRLGEVQYRRLLELKRADVLGQNPVNAQKRLEQIAGMEQVLRSVLAEADRMTVRDLDIKGRDLLELGYRQGRAIGDVLDRMLREVSAGSLSNEKQALLEFAQVCAVPDKRPLEN